MAGRAVMTRMRTSTRATAAAVLRHEAGPGMRMRTSTSRGAGGAGKSPGLRRLEMLAKLPSGKGREFFICYLWVCNCHCECVVDRSSDEREHHDIALSDLRGWTSRWPYRCWGDTVAFAKDTSRSCPAFKAGIDADNSGTLDLNEAKAAASSCSTSAIQIRMAR